MSRNKKLRGQRISAPVLTKSTGIHPIAEAKPSINAIYAKIIEQSADLSRKDIKKWRRALEAYNSGKESSSLYELQQLYNDLMMDGHVSSVIQIRKASILNTPYVYIIQDKVDEEWTKYFNQSEWVYNLTEVMIDTVFTGTTVVEFLEVVDKIVRFSEIPKTHSNPKYKKIFPDPSDTQKYIQYDDIQFKNRLIQIGKDENIGIVNNILVQLIWARHAEQSWSEFCERFGLPMVTANSNKTNKTEVDAMQKKLDALGEGVSAILPMGTTIDIKQPNNTDAYKVYMERINKCEEKISKQIVGGTMLTDNGSSRSQSEVHERNLNDKITLMDMRFNEFTWNNKTLPALRERGLAIPEGYLKLDVSEKIDYEKITNLITILIERFDIPKDWLSKTFGIPLEDKKVDTAIPKPSAKLNFNQLNDFFAKLIKEYNVPQSIIEEELKIPINFNMPSVENAEGVQNTIPICQSCGGRVADNYSASANTLLDNIRSGFVSLARKVFDDNLESVDQALMSKDYLDLFNDGLDRHFDYGSINYNDEDAICRQAMEMNLFRFSSAKTLSATLELNKALYNGDKKRTWADFKDHVDLINTEYNTNWLRAEYNHAVAVGQSSSSWFKIYNERDVIGQWEYQTMADGNVRPKHFALHGNVYDIEDKEARRIIPPNDWECRCEALQSTKTNPTISKGSDGVNLLTPDKKANKDFLIHFADERIVFTNNQMNLKNLTDNSIDELASKYDLLSYKDYGFEENPKSKTPLTLSNNTKEEIIDSFKEKKKVYTDFYGRALKLTKKQFLSHIKDGTKYSEESRYTIFDQIQGVVTDPNEVYLTQVPGKKLSMKHIKHFEDKSIVVVSEYNKDNTDVFNVKSWYYLDDNKNRMGFLIKGV